MEVYVDGWNWADKSQESILSYHVSPGMELRSSGFGSEWIFLLRHLQVHLFYLISSTMRWDKVQKGEHFWGTVNSIILYPL